MSNDLPIAIAFSAGVAFAAIAILARLPIAQRLADHPNERSLHGEPRPRVGGLGLLAGAIPAAWWFAGDELRWTLAAALALAAMSAVDDARGLPVPLRLAAHTAAAVVAVGLGATAPLSALALVLWLLLVTAIVWMTNLFNFMDGADGLAGGMAAIGFAALALAAARGGSTEMAAISATLSVAAVAFLAFNFPPARVFMGDAGSIPLGFLAGALGWHGVARGLWPVWFPLLVFSPFIVDATATLLKRLAHGERVWIAHRGHAYQRLVLAGWSHRRLALTAWLLMAIASASALLVLRESEMLQRGIIAAWAIGYSLALFALARRHSR
jgi:UDP-GlcNAc:undecaprenyl-phosphate/decaprenyl-phosphate GlcNAc-1-phosphate transferase